MKPRNSIVFVLFCILILTGVLCSCGGEAEEDEFGIGGYTCQDKGTVCKLSRWPFDFKMWDGKLYYSTSEEAYGSIMYLTLQEKPRQGRIQREFLFSGSPVFTVGGEEGVVYNVKAGTERGYDIIQYDDSGKEKARISFTEYVDGLQDVAVDGEGNYYLLFEGAMLILDSQGRQIQEIPAQNYRFPGDNGYLERLIGDGNGNIYYIAGSGMKIADEGDSGVVEWNTLNGLPGYSYPDDVYLQDDGRIFIKALGILYEYHMQEASSDAVLRFMEADMSGKNVSFVAAAEQEGQFYVVYGEDGSYEVRLLGRISVDEIPPRKIVTIGALSNLGLGETSELENAIVQFNRSNQQYYVTMKWYEASESTISRLDIDLVSDKAPDLLCLPNLDIENLAKKGALEDLTPYVEESNSIHLEDFIDPVLEDYRMDGILTCLPTGFSIGTIIGRGSQVGEESGWTMEEVMRLTEKYPEKKLFVGDYLLFDFCANYYLERFIDWESGSSSFDSDEFRVLAEWMKGQLTGDRNAIFYPIESVPEDYLLDYSASIDAFWTMQVEKARMEEVTFIGYPTVDGRPYHRDRWAHGQIGMLSHAKEKEGAWEFLEYYISLGKKYTSYDAAYAVGAGIPTQKEALKQYIENIEKERLAALKNEYRLPGPEDDEGRTFWQYSSMDGEMIPIYYPNEEDLEQYLELMEGIHFKPWSSGLDDEIQRIVEEELEYYFQGDKNLEEVTDIIDNKVNLMLSERK